MPFAEDAAVAFDPGGALDDDEGLATGFALPHQDTSGRHVDLIGQLPETFELAIAEPGEQRNGCE